MNQDAQTVSCTGCQKTIGAIISLRGQEWLQINGLVVRTLNGVCRECGAEFHWSTSDRTLARLVQEDPGS